MVCFFWGDPLLVPEGFIWRFLGKQMQMNYNTCRRQVYCFSSVSHFVTYLCVALMHVFWCWCKSEAWQIAMGQVSTCHCLTLRFSMARPKPKSVEKSRAIFEFSLVGIFADIIHQKVVHFVEEFHRWDLSRHDIFQFLWSFDSMSILLGIGLEGQIISSDSS